MTAPVRDPYAKPGALTPAGAQPIVRLERVEKFFGSNHVLRGCTLEVYPRETICLIGRSGSGKSTLLRCTNFLEEPTVGVIEVDGLRIEADPLHSRDRQYRERIRQIRQRAQMVFQEFNLFPHMKVIDNLIEGPLRVKGMARDEAIAIAEKYLDKVGLMEKRDEYPARLSGGQKQRVAIARALTMEPKVLLFDEPTSALDPTLVGEVLRVMEDLAHEGSTMIVVTHEMAFAREAADRVYFIEDGTFLEVGPPDELLDHPKDERTQRFLQRFLGRPRRPDAASVPFRFLVDLEGRPGQADETHGRHVEPGSSIRQEPLDQERGRHDREDAQDDADEAGQQEQEVGRPAVDADRLVASRIRQGDEGEDGERRQEHDQAREAAERVDRACRDRVEVAAHGVPGQRAADRDDDRRESGQDAPPAQRSTVHRVSPSRPRGAGCPRSAGSGRARRSRGRNRRRTGPGS